MGGTSGLFSLDQSDKNAFIVLVFGQRNFELNLKHLFYLMQTCLQIFYPIFD